VGESLARKSQPLGSLLHSIDLLDLYLYMYVFPFLFSEIAKHLSLPPVKLHCSMLAEDAIKAAVKDYEAKKGKLAKADE
jgi:hypothetical protein